MLKDRKKYYKTLYNNITSLFLVFKLFNINKQLN
jgi:hypothetical protein